MIHGYECKIASPWMLLSLTEEYLMRWTLELLAKRYGGVTDGPVWDGEEHVGKA
jgi:hypothetical protein